MSISERKLLEAWERSARDPPVRRSVVLLGAILPESIGEAIPAMSLAERDRWMLALRSELLGDVMDGWADCPACGQRVELALTAQLRQMGRGGAGDAAPTVSSATEPLTIGELRVSCRLPTCGDVLDALERPPAERTETLLLSCVLRVERGGQPVDPESLSTAELDAIADHLAELDDGALTELTFTCPACAANSTTPFDVTAHVCRELDAWAHEVLRDVHELAWAYGWSEEQILSLSAWRRRHYLEQVAS